MTHYLFIDGASLDATVAEYNQKFWPNVELRLDYQALRAGAQKVFYYDAIPSQLPEESNDDYDARVAEKRQKFNAIQREHCYHVRLGDMRRRNRRGNEQKMVDVQLAVDMMSFAHRGVFKSVYLLTGDLDFKPLIDAMIQSGIEVSLIYPKGHTAQELIDAADRAWQLNAGWLVGWLDKSLKHVCSIPFGNTQIYDVPIAGKTVGVFSKDGIDFEVIENIDGFHAVLAASQPEQRTIWKHNDIHILKCYIEDTFGYVFKS